MAVSKHVAAGLISGFFTACIWGSWPVVTRFGVTGDFAPSDIIAVRFLFASLVLLPYFIRNKVYQRVSFVHSLILSVGAGAPYVLIASSSLQYIPAGTLAVVMSGVMMILSAIGGYILMNERKGWAQIFGYFCIICGMLIANWQVFIGGGHNPLGYGFAVAGGLCWASFTVLSKCWKISPWDAVCAVSLYSLVIWTPIIAGVSGLDIFVHSWKTWAFQGIWQGVVTAIFGLWFYAFTVQRLGAGNGALFAALVPFIALILGAVFLSERPELLEMFGVVLASVGMVIAIRTPKVKLQPS